MNMECWWKDTDRGKTLVQWRKTCPNATLSTTNYPWTGKGWNPGLNCCRLATNCL